MSMDFQHYFESQFESTSEIVALSAQGPFVRLQKQCLPGLLFFLVSFLCTLFDLWMCSVYNALGSE